MTLIQLPAGFNRRYLPAAGISLALIWLWVAFDRSYQFPSPILWNVQLDSFQVAPAGFSVDAFDFPPINSESIKSICSDTQWNNTLVFTCENSVGGIGNIRNSILNSVRYTISAGGGLVMPKIVLRSSLDISNIRTGDRIDMDYMFDTHHFVESLRLSCPQLNVYPTVDDVPNATNRPNHISLIPESLVDHIPATGLSHPEEWRGTFYTWLEQYVSGDAREPRVVALGRSYLKYPIYSDGEGFALSFGGILKIRSDVRILATKILLRLGEINSPNMDLSQPILKKNFFGAHLRTEKDAKEGWPAPDWIYSRYETQSKLFIEQISASNLTSIYVASGDTEEVAKFAKDALPRQVTTKFDLLGREDRAELEKLAWDQQAMVDFLVMMKASDFAGVGHSSFAWNIALSRHNFAQKKNFLDGPQMLSDELSQIYGPPRGYPEYASCLWP